MKLTAIVLLLFAAVHCSKPHSVTLKWSGDPSLRYNVYRRQASQPSQGIVAQGVPCCEFTDKQVQAGTKYFYTVTSVRDGKESVSSPAIEANVPK